MRQKVFHGHHTRRQETAYPLCCKWLRAFRETTEILNHILDDSQSQPPSYFLDPLAGWLTLVAVLAILVVALFPFNFSVQATALRREGFFLDWLNLVSKHWRGWLLNVLFFVPFGFGWAWWTQTKGWRRFGGWLACGIAGLILSLAVESLQLYLPTRVSSWDDVFTNTLGSLVGWILYRYCGGRCLSFVDSGLEDLSRALEP